MRTPAEVEARQYHQESHPDTNSIKSCAGGGRREVQVA
jgi:hypothetical protein